MLVKAARRVEGRSPSWVLRATPLTFFTSERRTLSAAQFFV
nr:MAG TPA: hypothetical protein [Inoviridae sp.]